MKELLERVAQMLARANNEIADDIDSTNAGRVVEMLLCEALNVFTDDDGRYVDEVERSAIGALETMLRAIEH